MKKKDPPRADARDTDEQAGAELLALVIEDAARAPALERIETIVRGRLLKIAGGVSVSWAGAPEGALARPACALSARHVGGEVAIAFEEGDPRRPIVLGPMSTEPPPPRADDAEEGTVQFEADRELVLRCGRASLVLTKAGKIILRGTHVASIATGTHRILGGAVEIN